MFLDAFCFLIIPDLAIFISSEFNLGKNLRASDFFLSSLSLESKSKFLKRINVRIYELTEGKGIW